MSDLIQEPVFMLRKDELEIARSTTPFIRVDCNGHLLTQFDDPELVAIFGSWVRVQVAFYDFITQQGMGMCAEHLKQELFEQYHDGGNAYETMIKSVEAAFPSMVEAFAAFKAASKEDE